MDVRVEGLQGFACRLHLGHADAVVGVQDLTLEVAQVDDVMVNQPERPDAGGGEIEGGRRPQAAGPDEQHLGVEQLGLPFFANLGQQEVAAVARELVRGELSILFPRVAGAFPGAVAAAHRHDLLVAHVLELPGSEERARAARTVGDDGRGLVRDVLLDADLEEAARHRHRAGQMSLAVLVLLAHVDQHVTAAAAELLTHLVDAPLRHLAAGVFQ